MSTVFGKERYIGRCILPSAFSGQRRRRGGASGIAGLDCQYIAFVFFVSSARLAPAVVDEWVRSAH